MKLFSALALVTSSVNADCDWDLTKPIATTGPYDTGSNFYADDGI